MKTILRLAILFTLIASQAFAGITEHWVGRDGAVVRHRGIAGPVANTLIGDSITEGFWWNAIGSCRFVNAGYGWITAQAMAARLSVINSGASPRYVIIMLGTNNATATVDVAAYSTALQTIIDSEKALGATVILATILPIEPGKSLSASRSQAAVNALNNVIVQKATTQKIRYVDLNVYFRVGGVGKAGMSSDGLHPVRSTYLVMYNAYAAALRIEVARTKVPC